MTILNSKITQSERFLINNKSSFLLHFQKQLMLCIFTIMLACSTYGADFPLRKNIEAEDFISKEKEFAIRDDTFSSKGAYIAVKDDIKAIAKEKMIVKIPFREKGTFTIWLRARDMTLSLRSSNGVNKTLKTTSKGKWNWISAGKFSSKQIGAFLELYASKTTPDSGLDVILLSYDLNFRPQGIYNEFFSRKAEQNKVPDATLEKIHTVKFMVYPKDKSDKVSRYLATACADDPKRHLDGKKLFSKKEGRELIGNSRWDAMMKTFFKDNLLILLFRPVRNKDRSYNRWDFESLDRYVERAINVWGCKELMFLPRWDIPSTRKNKAPTKAELDAGEEFFMQLIKRYGKKGRLNVKYWVVADEWTLRRYWKNHSTDFIRYYSRLVKKAKAFNPELKLGGPVNAFPKNSSISKLIEECPELDFIAWNMYMTGNATSPMTAMYKRTVSKLVECLKSSREISKKIRKKELPVIVSAYGSNYRASYPPDFKLAGPSNGVWQALAMIGLVKGGAFAAGSFNVLGMDCGLFGPRDSFGLKGGFIPESIDSKSIYIRPSARIMRFFQKYIAGQRMCKIACSNQTSAAINYLATNHDDKAVAIVLVNRSPQEANVEVKIKDYKLTVYKEFDLPTKYIYCDQDKIMDGKGFIFNKQGIATIQMPPFSTWLFYVNLEKN